MADEAQQDMREQIHPQREQYWKQCTTEEKIERLRLQVKTLQWRLEILQPQLLRLAAHMHVDGQMMIPFTWHSEGVSQQRMAREDPEEVYF